MARVAGRRGDRSRVARGRPRAALHAARARRVGGRRQAHRLALGRAHALRAGLLGCGAVAVDTDERAVTRAVARLAELRPRSVDASACGAMRVGGALSVRRALAVERRRSDAATPQTESGALAMARVVVGLPRIGRERVRRAAARRTRAAGRRADTRVRRSAAAAAGEPVATFDRRAAAGTRVESAAHDSAATRRRPRQIRRHPLAPFELLRGVRRTTVDVARIESDRSVAQRAAELARALHRQRRRRRGAAALRLARLRQGLQRVAETPAQLLDRRRRRRPFSARRAGRAGGAPSQRHEYRSENDNPHEGDLDRRRSRRSPSAAPSRDAFVSCSTKDARRSDWMRRCRSIGGVGVVPPRS